MNTLKTLMASAALVASTTVAQAGSYPEGPVTVVFPNNAGGGFHTMLLAMQPMIEAEIGQALAIQTMAGGGTTVGTRFVTDQPADGYTMLFIHDGAFLTGAVGTLGFNTLDKLDPVAQVAESCSGVFTSPRAPYKSLAELRAYAQENPGKVRGGVNVGTLSHIKMVALSDMLGVEIRPVPIGGGAKVRQALIAGDVDLMVQPPSSEAGMVKAGDEVALAVSGKVRSSSMPEIPTIEEQGMGPLPLMCSGAFFWLRSDTPAEIEQFWVDALTAVFTNPDNVKKLAEEHGITTALVAGDDMDAMAETLWTELSGIVQKYKIGQ